MEVDVGARCCEYRGRDLKNSGGLWELKKAKETNFSLEPSEGVQPNDNLILAQ